MDRAQAIGHEQGRQQLGSGDGVQCRFQRINHASGTGMGLYPQMPASGTDATERHQRTESGAGFGGAGWQEGKDDADQCNSEEKIALDDAQRARRHFFNDLQIEGDTEQGDTKYSDGEQQEFGRFHRSN